MKTYIRLSEKTDPNFIFVHTNIIFDEKTTKKVRHSLLVRALTSIETIKSAWINEESDYISIEKKENNEWQEIIPNILSILTKWHSIISYLPEIIQKLIENNFETGNYSHHFSNKKIEKIKYQFLKGVRNFSYLVK